MERLQRAAAAREAGVQHEEGFGEASFTAARQGRTGSRTERVGGELAGAPGVQGVCGAEGEDLGC